MIAARRTRLRLVLRDLGAGAAFASMAVSGQLPVWTTAIVVLGLVLGLLQVRIFSGRSTVSVIALGIAGAVLYATAVTARGDLVVAACAFAGLLTVHRILSSPVLQTDNQIHLTSLLMIAGGAALSGEVFFAIFLILFAVLASLALSLAVLEAASPPGADIPLRPLLRPLGIGLLAAVLGSAAFFVLFPRLSWNVAARRVSPGLGAATTGFSDRVRLGGDGSIKRNPRIVLRATLNPDPGTDTLNAYWLGRTYETFTSDEWTNSGFAKPARTQVHLRPSDGKLLHQRIELLPAYGSRTLVALDPVVLLGNATAHTTSGSARTQLVEVDETEVRVEERALGYSYHAYSLLDRNASAPPPPSNPERLLALPPTLDPRVRELAQRIASNERDPLTVARRLEAYLKSQYAYSLELSGDVDDPLADFLFVRREGHCEHFATALAVLLRVVGIPSRVAAGFFGGERIGDEYVVRAGDAHAWTQALIPGRGFITLDATPDAHRQGQASLILEWLVRQYEALDELWRRGIVDYSFFDQAELARTLVRPPRSVSSRDPQLPNLGRLVLSALVGFATYVLVRRFTRRRAGGPRPEATALLEGVERLLSSARIDAAPGEGVEELAARLRAGSHPIAAPLGNATRRYLEARFGQRPLRPGERAHLLAALGRATSSLEKQRSP